MSSPPKDVTLSGLGPLSNPVAFRVYASLFLGCVIFGYTVLIASGAWIFVVVSFISLASTVRGMRRARSHRLPPEATVDTVSRVRLAAARRDYFRRYPQGYYQCRNRCHNSQRSAAPTDGSTNNGIANWNNLSASFSHSWYSQSLWSAR